MTNVIKSNTSCSQEIKEQSLSKATRTVRFDKTTIDKIDLFLKLNPFLDFSTLARLSINNFIENPNLKIQPINKRSVKQNIRSREV